MISLESPKQQPLSTDSHYSEVIFAIKFKMEPRNCGHYRQMVTFQRWPLVLESILPNFHFSGFPIFDIKLESLQHMKKMCVLYNGQAQQQKTEKFFVYKEKKFGRIDSRFDWNNQSLAKSLQHISNSNSRSDPIKQSQS